MTAAVRNAVFVSGATVLVTLSDPREKFWGVLLEVTAAGISLRGLDLTVGIELDVVDDR